MTGYSRISLEYRRVEARPDMRSKDERFFRQFVRPTTGFCAVADVRAGSYHKRLMQNHLAIKCVGSGVIPQQANIQYALSLSGKARFAHAYSFHAFAYAHPRIDWRNSEKVCDTRIKALKTQSQYGFLPLPSMQLRRRRAAASFTRLRMCRLSTRNCRPAAVNATLRLSAPVIARRPAAPEFVSADSAAAARY